MIDWLTERYFQLGSVLLSILLLGTLVPWDCANAQNLRNSLLVADNGGPADASSNQQSSPRIELKRWFLRPLKFTYGGEAPKNVYNFWGLGFKSEFENVMSNHPPALRRSKKAFPYNAMALAGWTGLLVFTLQMFIETVHQSSEVSKGKMVDDSFKIGPVIGMAVCGGVAIVGGSLGHSQLKAGVRMFNEHSAHATGVAPSYISPGSGPPSHIQLTFDFRHATGFSSILGSDESEWKNRGVMFLVGYSF